MGVDSEEGTDFAGDLGDDLVLPAGVGLAGVAGGAVVETGELHAPAMRERPGQRVAGGLEEGQALAACLSSRRASPCRLGSAVAFIVT